MNLNVKHKIIKLLEKKKKKNRRKSSEPRAKQRALKLVTKSTVH